MPILLSAKQARDLDRVRELIDLSQVELARLAGVSQGNVSSFLHGNSLRVDHQQSIHGELATAAQHALRKRTFGRGDVEFIRRTIAETRLSVERRKIKGARTVQGLSSVSLVSNHITELIMALTDAPRLNLTKSFDYFHDRHFRAHVRCVAYGIKYRWLAYETADLEREWDQYRTKLRDQLALEAKTESDNIDRLAEAVECRVYPRTAQRLGQLIPFRLTIFANTKFDMHSSPLSEGGVGVGSEVPAATSDEVTLENLATDSDVCVCTEEPEPRTYQFGQTMLLKPRTFLNLQRALENLYEVCPQIDLLGTPRFLQSAKENRPKLLACHKALRTALLRTILLNNSFHASTVL